MCRDPDARPDCDWIVDGDWRVTTSVRKARPHVHVHETQTASSLRSRTRPTYYSRTTGPLDSPYSQAGHNPKVVRCRSRTVHRCRPASALAHPVMLLAPDDTYAHSAATHTRQTAATHPKPHHCHTSSLPKMVVSPQRGKAIDCHVIRAEASLSPSDHHSGDLAAFARRVVLNPNLDRKLMIPDVPCVPWMGLTHSALTLGISMALVRSSGTRCTISRRVEMPTSTIGAAEGTGQARTCVRA